MGPNLQDAGFTVYTPSGKYIMLFHPRAVSDERDSRIAEMEKMFHRFEALPEDWDSYGAPVPYPEAIDKARQILTVVIDLNLPDPWTAPGGDAGIGLQWETANVDLYIDIVPGEKTTYALTPKTGDSEDDGVLTEQNLAEVLRRFAALTT